MGTFPSGHTLALITDKRRHMHRDYIEDSGAD